MGRQDSVTIASQHWGLFTVPAAASGFVSGVSALQRPATGLEKKSRRGNKHDHISKPALCGTSL